MSVTTPGTAWKRSWGPGRSAAWRSPARTEVLRRRAAYEQAIRTLLSDGVRAGRFSVTTVKLTSYTILDLGMGVPLWYREDGNLTEDQVVYEYGDFALRLAGAR
ncbi:hypothetical protein [Streptomyces sp. NRRL S-455]|uniref:hypothetical protein n=1 Tax=Streptomyces sp. NRRL S-455 TaxID=1463908 RepID=UPI000A8F8587|nr:hypothetical protein [Streptomyces sp. NRRL S-455]